MRTPHSLACSTVAKRSALAAQVVVLAAECGAVVEFDGPLSYAPLERGVTLALGPYRVGMSFSGTSRVGAFLGHWYTETRSNARYPMSWGTPGWEKFNREMGGPHKATTIATTFEAFLADLRRRFGELSGEK